MRTLINRFAVIGMIAPFLSFAGTPQCETISKNLTLGARGTDVVKLQNFLISNNFLATDNNSGYFGKLTQIATQQYQKKNGIVSSGTPRTTGYGAVGTKTRKAIATCPAPVIPPQPGPPPAVQPPPPTPPSPQPPPPAACTPLSPQTQVVDCSAGQTGTITQARTSSCPGPAWSEWQTASNTCTASQQPPLIGVIRWDAWFPNNTVVLSQYIPASIYTSWNYREPLYGWYDAGIPDAQTIMNKEINDAADHGLDYWAFNNYWATTNFPALQSQWPLYDAFKLYMASPYKSRLKFAFTVNAGALAYGDGGHVTPGFWDTYRPYLIEMFKDAQYLKVEGNRPVLFMQNDTQNFLAQWSGGGYPGWSAAREKFKAELSAAGLGEPFIVNTVMDLTGANDGIQGATTYATMNNAAKPTAGCILETSSPVYHCPFASQAAKDKSNWNLVATAGLTPVLGLTPVNDPRPRNYGFYVDQPTYTEWQQELKDALAFMSSNRANETNPPLAFIYAWNEIDEGGAGIIPTKQNGTMYLDAIKAVKTGNYPSTYQDMYNGDNMMITRSPAPGGPNNWVNYSPVQGNFNNDEEISQSVGETATLAVDSATGFEILGTKGPNRGVMEIFIDGVSQGIFTLTDPNWSQRQSLYKSNTLSAGNHALRIVNISTNVQAAQVGIDEILVTKSG